MDERLPYQTANCANYDLLKAFAKKMRNNMTEAERHLWRYLQNDSFGIRFRSQHIIGDYIADFVSLRAKLVIEIDGGYHSLPDQILSDEQRTEILERKGFKVIRFTNDEVLYKTGYVLSVIEEKISEIISNE